MMSKHGKDKHTRKAESPIICEANGPEVSMIPVERPISRVYPVIDNDLARDNVENDIPAADLEDL